MKRWMAALLVGCLVLCLAGAALAYTDYYGGSLGALGLSTAELRTPAWRGSAAAAVLRDYMAASGNTWLADQLGSGKCSMADFDGVGLDIYYPLRDGTYLNLYAEPGTGLVRDYGVSYFSCASNGYDYTGFSPDEVRTALIQ